ncbi:MAG: Mov34/MPN/PAD-1 family protein [Myxococcota bacterium]
MIHGLEIAPSVIEAIAAHGERAYPSEACGVAYGPLGAPAVTEAVALENVQDRYHARDPLRFPRTSRDAFRLDELEHMRLLERLENHRQAEKIIYHSHPDAGAYFSPEDRAMAVIDGFELLPGVVHVVVSIRAGKRHSMAAFRWDEARRSFFEARIALEPPAQVPDLAARAMEGSEAARPIAPHGLRLSPRRVESAELKALIARAAGRLSLLPEERRMVERLGLGLLSPVPGFLARSEPKRGQLPDGTPWLRPLRLLVDRGRIQAERPLEPGAILSLVNDEGAPLAALALEALEDEGALLGLPGALWVDQGQLEGREAAESRAELLRRGRTRVLAVRPGQKAPAGFDEVLEIALPTEDPWLDAVIAQNMGATHVLCEGSGAEEIRASLAIAPVLTWG